MKHLSDKLQTKLRELAAKPEGWGDVRIIEPADARAILAALAPSDAAQAPIAKTLGEYHEDHGNVVWFTWQDGEWLGEPSWIGSPNDCDWPGYHTHWTPHPAFPAPARTYTTQAGESVAGIALRQCGNEAEWRGILECNPKFEDLLPNDYFPVGTVLMLPANAAPVAPAASAPNATIDLQQVAALETAICNGQSSEALRLLHHVRNELAAPTPTVAPAAPINLEGLRKKLLTPRKILRDEDGYLTHPDFPICDEGTHAGKFLDAFGIDAVFVAMESDDPAAAERYFEAGEAYCSYWTPTPPEGDGWLLLEIYETEDGPCALFGRDRYEAENALKRQRMRAQLDRINQRQATQGEKE